MIGIGFAICMPILDNGAGPTPEPDITNCILTEDGQFYWTTEDGAYYWQFET